MFSVDFETLQQIIKQLFYTGVFRASVSASRIFPEDGYVELQVSDGQVYGCYFVSARGKTYKLDQWDIQLAALGVLDWRLGQQTSRALPRASSSSSQTIEPQTVESQTTVVQRPSFGAIPYHAVALSFMQLRKWSPVHRQVYSLADGRRQVPEIAQMLHKSLTEVEKIVQDLCQRGFIQMR